MAKKNSSNKSSLDNSTKNPSQEQVSERQEIIKGILSLREGVGMKENDYTSALIEVLTTADQLVGPDINGYYLLKNEEKSCLLDLH